MNKHESLILVKKIHTIYGTMKTIRWFRTMKNLLASQDFHKHDHAAKQNTDTITTVTMCSYYGRVWLVGNFLCLCRCGQNGISHWFAVRSSLMHSKNNKILHTEPWGTPLTTGREHDISAWSWTHLVRIDVIQMIKWEWCHMVATLTNNLLCKCIWLYLHKVLYQSLSP